MHTIVKTRIIKIGNSQGIRIPKLLLEQTTWGAEVELELQDDQIVIRPVRAARADWDTAFQAMHAHGDDRLLDGTSLPATTWDDAEWAW